MINSDNQPAEEVHLQITIDPSLKCRALSFMLVTFCVMSGLAIYFMLAYLFDYITLLSLSKSALVLLMLILSWLYFVRNVFSIVDSLEVTGNELIMRNVSARIIARDACRNVSIDTTMVNDLQISVGGYAADLSQIADDQKSNLIRILTGAQSGPF